MMAADFAFWGSIAFIVAVNVYYGPQIATTHVAMQWGVDGRPIWSAPKSIALWGVVVFALVVRGFIWIAMTYSPEKVNRPEIGVFLFSVIVAATHLWLVRRAMRQPS